MYSAQYLQRVFWWNQRALNMFQRAQNSSDNSSRNFIWWKYVRKVSVILISKMFKILWGVETSYFICSQTLMKYQISLSRIFFNIGIFKNFANFIKKETPTRVFSCEICEIFQSTSHKEHFRKTVSTGIKSKLAL